MSYNATVYKKGDSITAAKLNKIENALASNTSNFIVSDVNASTGLANITFQEAWNQMYNNNKIIFFKIENVSENNYITIKYAYLIGIDLSNLTYRLNDGSHGNIQNLNGYIDLNISNPST